MSPLRARALNCSSCGASIDIKNGLKAKTVQCPACDRLLDLTDPKYKVLCELEPSKHSPNGYLCVGMKGTLDGEAIEIVGRIRLMGEEYDEGWEYFHWDEFLVLTEHGQTHWLEVDEGNYTLHRAYTPSDPPELSTLNSGRTVELDGHTLHVTERGQGTIVHLEGELTWRAKLGDRANYVEARRGNHQWTVEWTDSEVEFFESERLSEARLFEVFQMTEHIQIADEQQRHRQQNQRRTLRLLVSSLIVFLGIFTAICLGYCETLLNPIVEASSQGLASNQLAEPGTKLGTMQLGSHAASYALYSQVTLVPPNNELTLWLAGPDGIRHQLVAYKLSGRGWGKKRHTTRFSVPQTGTYTLYATGTNTGKPRDTPGAGYRLVPAPHRSTRVKWHVSKITYQHDYLFYAAGLLALVSIPFLLLLFIGSGLSAVGRRHFDAELRRVEATQKLHQRVRRGESP